MVLFTLLHRLPVTTSGIKIELGGGGGVITKQTHKQRVNGYEKLSIYYTYKTYGNNYAKERCR